MSYSVEQLKQKLGMSGWRAQAGDSQQEGTLKDLAEAAHARHAEGKPERLPGLLAELLPLRSLPSPLLLLRAGEVIRVQRGRARRVVGLSQ